MSTTLLERDCARICARAGLVDGFLGFLIGPRQPLTGSLEVFFVDYVVAVEHGPGLMAADLHGYPLWCARPHHVTDRRPSAIVEELAGYPGPRARNNPHSPEITDPLAVSEENIGALGIVPIPDHLLLKDRIV